MIVLEKVLGFISDKKFENIIHELSHKNNVEYIILESSDVPRKRLRIHSDKGTDCAISLERDAILSDGAILFCSNEKALVVKINEQEWIEINVKSKKDSLRFGYFIGNLHWKVKFKNENVLIALEGPMSNYMDRIEEFLKKNEISIVKENYD